MLTYSLSRREKALILVLAIILVGVVWFMFVFQRTNDQINAIENEMVTVESNTTVAQAQVARMHKMEAAIEKYKAAGVKATPVPTFDNMTPLMTELNGIMGRASSYSLSFDALDTETSNEYILRGVTADFSCGSFSEAELIITALAKGSFPCSIDSVVINDSSVSTGSRASGGGGSAPVTASVHITFFEKYPTKTTQSSTSSSTAASSASASSASTS